MKWLILAQVEEKYVKLYIDSPVQSDYANEVAKQLVQLYRSTCLGRRH